MGGHRPPLQCLIFYRKLERQTQLHLDYARLSRGVGLSKRQSTQVRRDSVVLRVIERIEQIGLEFETRLFGGFESLRHRQVEIPDSRASQGCRAHAPSTNRSA